MNKMNDKRGSAFGPPVRLVLPDSSLGLGARFSLEFSGVSRDQPAIKNLRLFAQHGLTWVQTENGLEQVQLPQF